MKSKFVFLLIVSIILPFLFAPIKSFADGKYPVRITEQNIIAAPIDQNTLQLIQIVNFKNSGNEKEEQLPIYLPKGYSELQVRSGLEEKDMKVIEKGIVDVAGLDSGEEKQVVLSYTMPLAESKSQWAIETSYVTESFQIVIQPGILSFEANNLITQSDLFEMNNQEFRRFTRVDLHPERPWTLRFSFIGQSSSTNETNRVEEPSSSNYTADGYKILGKEGIGYGKAAITIALIVIAISMTLIGLKRDYQKSMNKSDRPTRKWLQMEKEILLQEIVQLEKDYQSKLISDKTYKETYNDIKEKMKRVIAESR